MLRKRRAYSRSPELAHNLAKIKRWAARAAKSLAGDRAEDARRVLAYIEILKVELELAPPPIDSYIITAMQIGELYGRSRDGIGELLDRGWKVLAGAKRGHEVTHGPKSGRLARNQRWKAEVAAMMTRGGISHSGACQRIAVRDGVNGRTVVRATRHK